MFARLPPLTSAARCGPYHVPPHYTLLEISDPLHITRLSYLGVPPHKNNVGSARASGPLDFLSCHERSQHVSLQ